MSKNKNGSKWIKSEEKRLSESGHFRLKDTVEPNSNFINLRGNYFNKGKYKGIEVDAELRCDLLIEDKLVLELKFLNIKRFNQTHCCLNFL